MNGDPQDTPWYLTAAISHALMILGFYELLDEDRPPERIWLDDEALTQHWDHVQARREAGSRGAEAVPQAPLDQNELTKDFKRG